MYIKYISQISSSLLPRLVHSQIYLCCICRKIKIGKKVGRKEEKDEMTVEISGEGLSIRISRVLITRNYNYLPAQAAIILGKKFSLNNVSALPFGEFHFLEEREREKA